MGPNMQLPHIEYITAAESMGSMIMRFHTVTSSIFCLKDQYLNWSLFEDNISVCLIFSSYNTSEYILYSLEV